MTSRQGFPKIGSLVSIDTEARQNADGFEVMTLTDFFVHVAQFGVGVRSSFNPLSSETLADLLVSQKYYHRALKIYKKLVLKEQDPKLYEKIDRIEKIMETDRPEIETDGVELLEKMESREMTSSKKQFLEQLLKQLKD